MGLERKYKGERIAARGSTMKDGCEYVSGIENTGGEFGRFTLVNFNFLFLLLRYGREFVYRSENCKRFSQMELKELKDE